MTVAQVETELTELLGGIVHFVSESEYRRGQAWGLKHALGLVKRINEFERKIVVRIEEVP